MIYHVPFIQKCIKYHKDEEQQKYLPFSIVISRIYPASVYFMDESR
jgi:hypothetical protein